MSRSLFTSAACLLVALVVTCTLHANDKPRKSWPAWRGADSSGSVAEGSYAASWIDEDRVRWKVELPGVGRSTPAVYEDHILVTCPKDGQDAVLDFDWSGKLRWSTSLGTAKKGKHRNGSGSNGSPVTDGKLVFAYYRSGNLGAVDFEGKVHWKTNVQERFGKDTLWWDSGTSPALTSKSVVVAVMHSGDSYLAAFEKATGNLLWKQARNYKTPVEGDHAYTTPIVIRDRERELILVWGAEHITAHDAVDGSVVWSCGGFNPKGNSNWVAVASAVVSEDMIVVPYGRGAFVAGVKLGGKGDVTSTHRAWTREGVGAFVPTPAAHENKIYVVRDRGEVVCLDAKSGKTIWTDRLPKHRSSYYASPLIADGKLYAAREDGVVFVAQIDGGFKVLSENNMEEPVIASPVAVDGKLLLRSQRHLYCVQ